MMEEEEEEILEEEEDIVMEEPYGLEELEPEQLMEEEYEDEDEGCCSQGHSSSFYLPLPQTDGRICLVCFSNTLRCSPLARPPTLRLSHTISLVAQAVSDAVVRRQYRFLVSPLVRALASFHHCELVATQLVKLVTLLSAREDGSDESLYEDFVEGISESLVSNMWSRAQIYLVHCLGIILNCRSNDKNDYLLADIRNTAALISSLVNGLQLSSEEIHGEIFFVLYKLFILLGERDEEFLEFHPKLLYLSLQALMKAQNDVVRSNCLALLTLLARRGYMGHFFSHDPQNGYQRGADRFGLNFQIEAGFPLVSLFADAIKGPLLASDVDVQICALDLMYHSLSLGVDLNKQIQVLVEEGVSDYVFEVLRLSDNKDHLVVSSIQVLDLLSNAEQAFSQCLSVGFPTLLTVLHHIVEIPLHPVQCHTLKLVLRCISDSPEIVSGCQIEELVLILSWLFRRESNGDTGMLAQTFTVACSTFLAVLKLPASPGIPKLEELGQELLNYAILPSLYVPRRKCNEVFLYSLYLLKETYSYNPQSINKESISDMGLAASVIKICESHILPWLKTVLDKVEEEEVIIMGVLETFHSILLHGYDPQATKFAETLASLSWFTLSYGYLGLYPSDGMKCRVYLVLSSIVDGVLGHEAGQPIRDASKNLPSDPADLLFLLGQKSSHDGELVSCQAAVLLIFYTSALYDERIADEKQVLASLEQYILVNSTNFFTGIADLTALTQVVNLYSLLRGAMDNNRTPYSPEAEKLLFRLMVEKEWSLLSTKIHPTAVKWLFQQEEIIIPMSNNVLSFCRHSFKDSHSGWHTNDQPWTIDVRLISDLVAVGDNYSTSTLVALLRQLYQDGQEEDGALVMNLMIEIINRSPVASDQFCLHGIAQTIQSFLPTKYSSGFFTTSLLLLCTVLHSASPNMLVDQNAWVSVTRKLLEHFAHTSTADTCNHDQHLLLAVLSLILYQSTHQVLAEASTAILCSAFFIYAVNIIIQAACAKGPTLIDYDETTNTGESLCFILLLYFFSLRSSHVFLQGSLDWQDFILSTTEARPVIFISCQDLCRLVHFGSPLIKLIASQCLLELLTKISEQMKSKQEELKYSIFCIQSLVAILEGMVFFGDTRVAINCALCLAEIFGWEKLDMSQQDKWCRLVVEELALLLVLPSFASKSFTNQLKPPIWIAITLLKLNQAPKWLESIFDASCISSIIGNLSAGNVSTEMVQLFRELVAHKYLNSEQVANLNHIFQACRKHAYMVSSQEQHAAEQFESIIYVPDDTRKVLMVLVHLMSGRSVNFERVQTDPKRLLEEIEFFSVECPGKEHLNFLPPKLS